MVNETNFSTLGDEYQLSLIKVIFDDKRFATTVLEILDPHFFDGGSFRYIVQIIKDYFEKYNEVADYQNVSIEINKQSTNDTAVKMHLDTIKLIKEHKVKGDAQIKEAALDFCKQQFLKKEIKRVQSIIDRGDFDSYPEIEEIIKKALQVGTTSDNIVEPFDDIGSVLDSNFRVPIPTGIDGVDEMLKGGVAKGELALLLAATGVGKTTLFTKIANSGYVAGNNVLQIIFEDNINTILRKHYTIWTEYTPDELPDHREEVIATVKEVEKNTNGVLKIAKLPSDSVTVSQLKSMIRKLIMEGFTPDEILIDYVDCIVPEKAIIGEEWKGEGGIMRQLEAMTSEFDVAIWVATQGNREAIATELVTTDLMGGSIKKGQIAHIQISVGKSLEQKENNLATMALMKSRIGKDGVIWTNCIFDNERLIISTESQTSVLGHQEDAEERKESRRLEVYRKSQKNEHENIGNIKLDFNMDDEKAEKLTEEINNFDEPVAITHSERLKQLKKDKTPKTQTVTEFKADKTELKRTKRAAASEKRLDNVRKNHKKVMEEKEIPPDK